MTQDLYYIESGYLTPDAGYYVYTADAEAAVSSASTMDITAGVIRDCVSTITCQATVAAVISHIHGADLVAFSNAAIATEINVIRNNNVALTSVFSAAIDAVRGIYVSAQADSSASLDISNQRVRYTEAAHSAAFSLAADVSVVSGVVLKEAEANLSSEFTQTTLGGKRQRFEIAQVVLSSQSTTVERTRDTTATIVSQSIVIATVGIVKEGVSSQNSLFTFDGSANRTREFDSAVLGAFTPTLSVDVFKNSFAVLDSTASLTVEPITIKVATISTSSQFTQVAVGGKDIRTSAALNAYTNLLASRNIARSRPVLLTNIGSSFNSSIKKYGSHSLSIPSGANGVIFTNDNRDMEIPANTDFLIELWVNVNNGGILATPNNLLLAGVGDMTALSNMNANDSWGLGWAGNFPVSSNTKLTFKFATASNTFTTIQTGEGAYSANGWNHIVVRRLGSTIYLSNNTTGDGASATYSGAIYQGTYKKLQLKNPFGYSASSPTTELLVDEFNFKIGSVDYGSEDAATSQAINNPDNNVFLYHFNNDLVDDVSVTFNQNAALSSIVSTFATITGPQRTSATLVSQSSLSAQVNKTGEINLVAFSNSSVSTNGQRIRNADSAQASSFAQAVDPLRVRFADASLASAVAQDTTVVKTVNPTVATDAIFTELAAVARTGAGFVQLDVQATMAITAVKTTDVVAPISSEFAQTTVAVKSVIANASISSNATVDANNARIRNQVLVYAVNSQLEVIIGEIEQFSIELTAVSSLLAETGGILQGFANISSQASVAATILRIRDGSSSLASEFTQTANTVNSKTLSASASLSAEATVAANAGTIKQTAITTDAIFTELAAVAKTGQGFITLDSQATLSADITKTSGASADIASQATVVAEIGKLQTADSAISSTATLTTSGTFVTTASANFSVAYTLVCNVVKTADAISLEASAGTLTANVVANKRATAQLSVLAFELALGSRTQTAQATLTSTSTMVAQVGGTFGFRSTMQGFAAEVIVADIIHIDAKLTWMIFAEDRDYSIQSDTRTYSIVEEDRDYSIVRENREYAVTRELLTTELQGV